jgi:bisphosphoglycerate-independent phosphoglycerate mutase
LGKKAILVITDGIGYSNKTEFNAFYNANKAAYDKLFKETSHSLIDTSGLSVGLPEGQMGNSEVGHMCIGSGRVLYQDLVRISLALSENTMQSNEELQNLFKKSERLHLIGLLSDGGVHSHIDHFMGIADIAAQNGKKVFLHLITDGRDVSPTSAQKYIKQVQSHLNENITIATISGRFYSMDRDNRWERVQRGYDAIVNATPKTDFEPAGYIGHSYSLGETDEFVEPTAFNGYVYVSESGDPGKFVRRSIYPNNPDNVRQDNITFSTHVIVENKSNEIIYETTNTNNEIAGWHTDYKYINEDESKWPGFPSSANLNTSIFPLPICFFNSTRTFDPSSNATGSGGQDGSAGGRGRQRPVGLLPGVADRSTAPGACCWANPPPASGGRRPPARAPRRA